MKTKQIKCKRWPVKYEENQGRVVCLGSHVNVFQVYRRHQLHQMTLKRSSKIKNKNSPLEKQLRSTDDLNKNCVDIAENKSLTRIIQEKIGRNKKSHTQTNLLRSSALRGWEEINMHSKVFIQNKYRTHTTRYEKKHQIKK